MCGDANFENLILSCRWLSFYTTVTPRPTYTAAYTKFGIFPLLSHI